MSEPTRKAVLIAAFLIIGTLLWVYSPSIVREGAIAPIRSVAEKAEKYSYAREIVNPSGFLNSGPFEIADHIGKKVILVDFWTYSCINCQRTMPYLTAWDEKYREHGLLIVGMHTPEFEFEKMPENVMRAMEEFGIKYPVVQDNDFGTWRAYGNRYWPRKYLIDIDGYIVYDHIGEGGYMDTEGRIQQLLRERQQRLGGEGQVPSGFVTPLAEAVTDRRPRTPEIYFGAWRNAAYLANGRVATEGQQSLAIPPKLEKNKVYLDGVWNVTEEYARNLESGARITLDFQAKNVFFVGRANTPVEVKVYLDGEFQKTISVAEDRLYRLVELSEWAERSLELIIESPGLEAFTFTFG